MYGAVFLKYEGEILKHNYCPEGQPVELQLAPGHKHREPHQRIHGTQGTQTFLRYFFSCQLT